MTNYLYQINYDHNSNGKYTKYVRSEVHRMFHPIHRQIANKDCFLQTMKKNRNDNLKLIRSNVSALEIHKRKCNPPKVSYNTPFYLHIQWSKVFYYATISMCLYYDITSLILSIKDIKLLFLRILIPCLIFRSVTLICNYIYSFYIFCHAIL